MGILRVEEVVYQVVDLARCVQFCQDFGLRQVGQDSHQAQFRTQTNQQLTIGQIEVSDEFVSTPGIVKVVWGVAQPSDLDDIRKELEKDRPAPVSAEGEVSSIDNSGLAIAFRVAAPADYEPVIRPVNSYGRVERWNTFLEAHGRVRPIRLIHVAIDIPKEGREAAISFYSDRLKFRRAEEIEPTGCFLQCEGETDHHQFFLCHRTNAFGTNHLAFEVQDIDEVVEGGNFMIEQGWKEVRRLGRHTVGSNVFRFFTCPLGGRFEYAFDMDKLEKDAPTRYWPESPPHHLWLLKTPTEAD